MEGLRDLTDYPTEFFLDKIDRVGGRIYVKEKYHDGREQEICIYVGQSVYLILHDPIIDTIKEVIVENKELKSQIAELELVVSKYKMGK